MHRLTGKIRAKACLANWVLVATGLSGMILIFAMDFLRGRGNGFGPNQWAGMIVAAIITLSGVRQLPLLSFRQWRGLLLLIYLAGTLYLGLKFNVQDHFRSTGPLREVSFSLTDAVMNLFGFVPLGYLMISFMTSFLPQPAPEGSVVRFGVGAWMICVGISFFIELVQYYLPGRTSSIVDLLNNGLGALLGVAYGWLEHRFRCYLK